MRATGFRRRFCWLSVPVVAFSLVSGCAPKSAIFTSDGVQLTIPSEWEKRDEKDRGIWIMGSGAGEDFPQNTKIIAIWTKTGDKTGHSGSIAVMRAEMGIPSNLEAALLDGMHIEMKRDKNIIEGDIKKVGEREAAVIEALSPNKGQRAHYFMVMGLRDGGLDMIVCGAEESKFEAARSDLKKCINSVNLILPKPKGN